MADSNGLNHCPPCLMRKMADKITRRNFIHDVSGSNPTDTDLNLRRFLVGIQSRFGYITGYLQSGDGRCLPHSFQFVVHCREAIQHYK